jgi:hypothetical protein
MQKVVGSNPISRFTFFWPIPPSPGGLILEKIGI